jgi:hypothetical protein
VFRAAMSCLVNGDPLFDPWQGMQAGIGKARTKKNILSDCGGGRKGSWDFDWFGYRPGKVMCISFHLI